MSVVVIIKKGLGGSGISQAARYLSTRERNEEREGQAARGLFSHTEDRLNYSQANRQLGGGREPKTDDVLHVVISFHQEADFKQLGADEEARLAGMRKTTRTTLQEMGEALNTKELHWVAGIHRNTDNPHIHLLIHRDYTDQRTGRTKRLQTLPKEMRVSWKKDASGERRTNPGLLSQTFEKHLAQNIHQFTEEQKKSALEQRADRVTLGQALVASDRIGQLQEALRTATAFGERRRYGVVDEGGRARSISEFDLRRKAQTIGSHATAQMSFSLPAATQAEVERAAIVQELGINSSVTKKICAARYADANAVELELQQAARRSQPILSDSAAIKDRYAQAGAPLPTPILSLADLNRLQSRAISRGDAKKLNELEGIRQALIVEGIKPPRSDVEVGRLRAQLFVAQSRRLVEQQAAARFEQIKHLRQWPLSDGDRQPNRSLAAIDSALAVASDGAKLIGKRQIHWSQTDCLNAQETLKDLGEQRVVALTRIAEEQTRLAEEVERRTAVAKVLHAIDAREQKCMSEESRPIPAALFSEQELRELDWHAARRHDPQFYQTLDAIERDSDRRNKRDPKEVSRDRFSRALARAVMAEVELRESEARLTRFKERCEQIAVVVNEERGQAMTVTRLADVEPHSPWERLFIPLLVRGERYRAVATAIATYGGVVHQHHERNKAAFSVLNESVRKYEQELTRLNPGIAPPRPQFTASEVSRLELQAIKEPDAGRRDHYAKLYSGAVETAQNKSARTIILDQQEAKATFEFNDHVLQHANYHHREAMGFER